MRSRYHCTLDDSETVRFDESALLEYRPTPGSHLLMLTGSLAKSGLERMMEAINPDEFTYEIREMPYAVIAWMLCEDVPDKIGSLEGVDVVMIPGKISGNAVELQEALGVPVVRGPNCYSELGTFLEVHGFVRDTSDPPKPKVVVREKAPAVAAFVAQTYEVPLIDVAVLIDAEIERDTDLGQALMLEPPPHNAVAELVRGRLSLPDAAAGWVMVGYPKTLRDTQWIEEMGQVPDAYLAVVGKATADPVVEFYRNDPIFLQIDPKLPERVRQEQALVMIENRMQACVAKV